MRMKRMGRFEYSARFIASLLMICFAGLLVVVVSTGVANAQSEKQVRAKMVDLNMQALTAIDTKDFDLAKSLLLKAVDEGKQNNLQSDAMMARTYVHLGVVWFAGFQDKQKAMHYFGMSKGIRPDIKLTPALVTPDLTSLFEESAVEEDVPTTPTDSTGGDKTEPKPDDLPAEPEGGGASLPTTFTVPLLCEVPEEIVVAHPPIIRCALQPGLSAKRVLLNFRTPKSAEYQVLAMSLSSSGWYEARIPSHALTESTLQVYFTALDDADEEVASNGREDSPSIISVKSSRRRGKRSVVDEDPLGKARRQNEAAEYESALHRRRQGAFWLSMGAGTAGGYSPAGITPLEWNKDIKSISPITTTVGYFHMLPEIGYMLLDNFGLALQARYEVIFQEQLKGYSSTKDGSPKGYALAGFLRGIYYIDLWGGNLQFSVSGDVGGGALRYPVRPVLTCQKDDNGDVVMNPETNLCQARQNATIYRTDTIFAGPVIMGGSAGIIYHLTRWLAVNIEGRGLAAFPKLGFAFEAQGSLQVAFGGGKSADASDADEESDDREEEFDDSLSDPYAGE